MVKCPIEEPQTRRSGQIERTPALRAQRSPSPPNRADDFHVRDLEWAFFEPLDVPMNEVDGCLDVLSSPPGEVTKVSVQGRRSRAAAREAIYLSRLP